MFRAPVHGGLHDDAAARSRRTIDFVAVDQPPLAAWSPVAIEIVVGVIGILLGMLLPIGVLKPYAAGAFVILSLEITEKLRHDMPLRIITHVISDPGQHQPQNYSDDDQVAAPAIARLIVFLGVH